MEEIKNKSLKQIVESDIDYAERNSSKLRIAANNMVMLVSSKNYPLDEREAMDVFKTVIDGIKSCDSSVYWAMRRSINELTAYIVELEGRIDNLTMPEEHAEETVTTDNE